MKRKVRTSVVIACHNCEKTIDLCLKSVLMNKPDEVIVVDDASTDNSVRIIKKYPVKLISLRRRGGVAKAEMMGIKNAKGDIIFITNADVIVPPNWIEKHLELHKVADCVGCWIRCDVEEGVRETLTLPAYNCSFKRKVLEKIGNIDETLVDGSEDVEFFLRAKNAGFRVVEDLSMPVLHHHYIPSYFERMRKSWRYGYRLGRLMRKYPHGKLMNKWFLLLPVYWIGIFFRDFKKFLKDYLLKIVESLGKFVGFILE